VRAGPRPARIDRGATSTQMKMILMMSKATHHVNY